MVSAFSIGTAKRESPKKNDVPAPNTYLPFPQAKSQSPKWTIGGIGSRTQKIKSFTPGPGQYQQKSSLCDVPSFTLKGRIQQRVTSNSPGPGNYNEETFTSVQKKIPSFSMGIKLQSKVKSVVPGPGTYQLTQIHNTQTNKFPIGKRLKTVGDRADSPGPGSYSITNFEKFSPHKSQPQWIFGQKCQHQSLDLSVPGPGMYDIKSTLTQQSFTLKPKLKSIDDNLIPGPGKYTPNLKFVKQSQPVYKIGTEMRVLKTRLNTEPGPGKYYQDNFDCISRKTQPCFKMSKAYRTDFSMNDSIHFPGPGTYEPQKKKLGNITLKGKNKITISQNVPGPGTYNPKDVLCRSFDGSVKIVDSQIQQKRSPTSDVPGPGTYEYKTVLMGPKWGFGKSKKRRQFYQINTSPGPGQYNIPSKIADVPKYLNCQPKFQV